VGHSLLGAAISETHSATLIFLGDRVYKLKKPVDLGFLDFSTRAAREAVCHREVELNRRLAPDVYLGVADVLGPDGAPCDHVVVMRRLPEERRLATLARAGGPLDREVRDLAHVMARFHEAAMAPAPEIAAEAASRDALARRWDQNLEVLEGAAGVVVDAPVVARVAGVAREYLAGRSALFEHRLAAGRVRDGHGDLLADDIFCLEDGPRVLDCIEFDDRLRIGDVLADVAFLAMDLERLGRPDLSSAFLTRYRELTADTWPASLAHHYLAYRASVRAKVACIRHGQGGYDSARSDARLLLELADRHLRAGRVRLVVVGGLPATGKSTVAAGVAGHLGAVHLRSDELRKELAGLSAAAAAPAALGEGIYERGSTEATYRALLDRAAALLAMGESVVLDATFGDPRWRSEAAHVAQQTVADLTELRCATPIEVAAARAARRFRLGADVSDADDTVVRALAPAEVAWPTAATINTSGTPDDAIAAAMAVVEA